MISGREWVHITRLVAPKINSVCAGICCIRNKASCRLINSHTAILHIISPSLSSWSLYLKNKSFPTRRESSEQPVKWEGFGTRLTSRGTKHWFCNLVVRSICAQGSLTDTQCNTPPVQYISSAMHLQCNTSPVQYTSSAIHLQCNTPPTQCAPPRGENNLRRFVSRREGRNL